MVNQQKWFNQLTALGVALGDNNNNNKKYSQHCLSKQLESSRCSMERPTCRSGHLCCWEDCFKVHNLNCSSKGGLEGCQNFYPLCSFSSLPGQGFMSDDEYLEITGITRDQSGEYECSAVNDVAAPDIRRVKVTVNCKYPTCLWITLTCTYIRGWKPQASGGKCGLPSLSVWPPALCLGHGKSCLECFCLSGICPWTMTMLD